MSPVNSDDAAGVASGGAGRPLTRKEIRAREKLLATQGHDVIPPQAFETGGGAPATAAARAAAGTTPAETVNTPTPAETLRPEAAQPETLRPEAVEPLTVRQPVIQPETLRPEAAEPLTVRQPIIRPEAPLSPPEAPQVPAAAPTVHEEPLHTALVQAVPVHDRDAGHGQDFQHRTESTDGHAARPEGAAGHELTTGATSIPTAKGPSKKVRRRRRFLALVLTLTVFVIAVVVGAQFLKPFLGGNAAKDYPGPGTGQVVITVAEGAGPKSVATELQDRNVVADAGTFLKAFMAAGGALRPGEFIMRREMKTSDAVAVLLNDEKGKVMYLALNAGLRIGESLQAISEGTGIPLAELRALSDAPAQFGVPAKAMNLEGFLAPGEFRFPLGTSAREILQTLVSTTLDELKAQGVTDPDKQYEAVTVASIVQAEGGQAEYGDVAGAIYNRLKPGNTETYGLIQSDATVTYGLGIRSFHIDEAQKADKSNPYNTYANTGLPAGPIGSPGKTAIDAAANPKTNDYLYWVTINLDTKETKFSKTLAEHNGYVALYNAWCNDNPGRCV